MAEKAVIIGIFVGLVGSAGLIWAQMPPRPDMHLTTTGIGHHDKAAEVRVIPIDKPKTVELPAVQSLPTWAEHHPELPKPKEVMPSDNIKHSISNSSIPEALPRKEVMPAARNILSTTDTRPRQVPLPKARPVGAIKRHCLCRVVARRPVLLLPPAEVRIP